MIIEKIVSALINFIRPDMSAAEVEGAMQKLAAGDPEKLNWKTSIVDLLKLLDLDSSLEARKELAEELGYEGKRDGSAEMNTWLHSEVLREVAKRDIRLPH